MNRRMKAEVFRKGPEVEWEGQRITLWHFQRFIELTDDFPPTWDEPVVSDISAATVLATATLPTPPTHRTLRRIQVTPWPWSPNGIRYAYEETA